MNTFGDKWAFTSFGESHGAAIGGVLDGVPAGLHMDMELIRHELERRRGEGHVGVSRRAASEPDEVEWLSGVIDEGEGLVTLGTPVAFLIRNRDARAEDYAYLRETFRPGHADATYMAKYGIRDRRGGGRASARETAARVVAGSIARQVLSEKGITIEAELVQVGEEKDPTRFEEVLRAVQADGDSVGGIIRCVVRGLPAGLGEPIFDKIQAHLAFAMLSINACKGFDYGTGFERVALRGSEANRYSGGLAGGITDGTDLVFRVVFKPTPSISRPQQLADGTTLRIRGRHDVCVAVRAVPVVEAMTALVLADFID